MPGFSVSLKKQARTAPLTPTLMTMASGMIWRNSGPGFGDTVPGPVEQEVAAASEIPPGPEGFAPHDRVAHESNTATIADRRRIMVKVADP